MKPRLLSLWTPIALLLVSSCQGSFSSEFVIDNSKTGVFYEIFANSFYDANGDGKGDLQGVETKLPYLVDLGISGIWFMPIHPATSYHGYDVTNYTDISPALGTLADFDSLVKKANQHNIDIMLDLVVNHTSVNHPWFTAAKLAYSRGDCLSESSYCHYYHFSDTGKNGYSFTDGIYYEARFWSGMPDLNLDNPYVQSEIRNIVSFWINRGVKGFRLDAVTSFFTSNLNKNIAFLGWLNDMIKEIDPSQYIVVEGPWSSLGEELLPYYESGIDSMFNFPISVTTNRLYNALRQKSGQSLAGYITDYHTQLRVNYPQSIDAPFLSNHDQGRSAGLIFPDINFRLESRKTMGSIYLLMPGRPFIYYGEEIEMRGSGIDENKRLPMVWSEKNTTGKTDAPPNANYDMTLQVTKGAIDQRKDPNSLLNHYRRTIAIRSHYQAFMEKPYLSLAGSLATTYGLRYDMDGNHIIILTNFSTETVIETISGDYIVGKTLLPIDGVVNLTKDNNQIEISLPPLSTVVLEVNQ
jgi:glycosidase